MLIPFQNTGISPYVSLFVPFLTRFQRVWNLSYDAWSMLLINFLYSSSTHESNVVGVCHHFASIVLSVASHLLSIASHLLHPLHHICFIAWSKETLHPASSFPLFCTSSLHFFALSCAPHLHLLVYCIALSCAVTITCIVHAFYRAILHTSPLASHCFVHSLY